MEASNNGIPEKVDYFDFNDFKSSKNEKKERVRGKGRNINPQTIKKVKSFGAFTFKLIVGGVLGGIAGAAAGIGFTVYTGGSGALAIPIGAAVGAVLGIALVISGVGTKTLLKNKFDSKNKLDLKHNHSAPNRMTKVIDYFKAKFFGQANPTGQQDAFDPFEYNSE